MSNTPESSYLVLFLVIVVASIFVFVLWGTWQNKKLRKKGTRLALATTDQKSPQDLIEVVITNASCIRIFGDYLIKGFGKKSSTISITLDTIDLHSTEVIEMVATNESDALSSDPGSLSLYVQGTNIETLKVKPQNSYKLTIAHFYQNPYFKTLEVRTY